MSDLLYSDDSGSGSDSDSGSGDEDVGGEGVERVDSRLTQDEHNVAPVRRVRCPVCKQTVPEDTLGVPGGHNCAAVRETSNDFLLMYQCARCGDVFTSMSNIGNWQCRMHPGKYTLEGYTCCGRKRFEPNNPAVHNMVWSRRGVTCPDPFDPAPCTPCDHVYHGMPMATNTVWYSPDVQRDLPDQVFANLVPLATERPGFAVVKNKDGESVGVLRGRDQSPAEKKEAASR